jgi:hypothetical protein
MPITNGRRDQHDDTRQSDRTGSRSVSDEADMAMVLPFAKNATYSRSM